jgi:myo-inositol 2-dehydrogenase/D-chiro-inositol 1-dehydrogenase
MGRQSVKIAIFGAGRIGTMHARNIAAHAQLELAVVCDVSEASASRLGTELGCPWTTDPDDILHGGGLDGALVTTPNGTHVEYLRRTTAAGLPTLCEKPLDLSIERIRDARDAILSTGVPVMIGFHRRFDASIGALIRRVAAGEIGAVEQVIISSRDVTQHPKEYLATSGGIFRDMTIHEFDLARCFVPDVVAVNAIGTAIAAPQTAEVGDFDSATVVMRGRAGELVTIVDSRCCTFGYDQRMEVFGKEGMLTVGNVTPTTVRGFSAAGAEIADPYISGWLERYSPAYLAELDAFAESIRTGRSVGASYDDGMRAVELANAAAESASTGRVVSV